MNAHINSEVRTFIASRKSSLQSSVKTVQPGLFSRNAWAAGSSFSIAQQDSATPDWWKPSDKPVYKWIVYSAIIELYGRQLFSSKIQFSTQQCIIKLTQKLNTQVNASIIIPAPRLRHSVTARLKDAECALISHTDQTAHSQLQNHTFLEWDEITHVLEHKVLRSIEVTVTQVTGNQGVLKKQVAAVWAVLDLKEGTQVDVI